MIKSANRDNRQLTQNRNDDSNPYRVKSMFEARTPQTTRTPGTNGFKIVLTRFGVPR